MPPRVRHASAAPSRAKIFLSSGVWYVQEQVRLRDGTFRAFSDPIALSVVNAPSSDVSLSGTTLTLKSGLVPQPNPHQATIQWRLALSSLSGLSLTIGKQHVITVGCDTLPASTINAYFGAVLTAPTGAWDVSSETISAVALGFGSSAVNSTRYAILSAGYANLIADSSIIASQMAYEEASSQCDIRALAASSVVQKSHQTTSTTTATHLYLVAMSQTANLLADATFSNPTVTISYGS